MPARLFSCFAATLALVFLHALSAAEVALSDPAFGGIRYKYTVTLAGQDEATFSNHVASQSWDDPNLSAPGEPSKGRTSGVNWIALRLTQSAVLTVRLERDAAVPWPSAVEPGRLASVAGLYPAFTIWQGWDNDGVPQSFADEISGGEPLNDYFTFFPRGAVEWAEDLSYRDHAANAGEETIERTFRLPKGNYTLAIGSRAPRTASDRQGYKATFRTEQISLARDDAYFVTNSTRPLMVTQAEGLLANDEVVPGRGDIIDVFAGPQQGTVVVQADGSFSYSPGPYFGLTGYDSFSYRLLGGEAGAAPPSAKVAISTSLAAAGLYVGHAKDQGNGEIHGLVKLKLTAAGLWTGSVKYDGKAHVVSGRLLSHGELKARGPASLSLLLLLTVSADGTRSMHAEIHDSRYSAPLLAELKKSPFDKHHPPPCLGGYELVLSVTSSSGLSAPKGNGHGRLTIARDGSAIIRGRLGDRTAFSGGSALVISDDPAAGPVLPIYSVYRASGSLSGGLNFGFLATSPATGTLKAVHPSYEVNYQVTSTPVPRVNQTRR